MEFENANSRTLHLSESVFGNWEGGTLHKHIELCDSD